MDDLQGTFTRDTPIEPVDWPMNREIHDNGWRPPAGTRIISVDDHDRA